MKISNFPFNFNLRIPGIRNSISLYQFVVQIFRTRYINLRIFNFASLFKIPREGSARFRDTLYIRIRWSRRRIRLGERGEKMGKMRIAEMDRCLELESLCPRYSGVSRHRIEMGTEGAGGKGPDFCTRQIEI